MAAAPIPKDVAGNELAVGNTVTIEMGMPIIWKIEVLENGGIQTPTGQTPALVRLVADVTLRSVPGLPFKNILRCVTPSEQKAVEAIAAMLGKA